MKQFSYNTQRELNKGNDWRPFVHTYEGNIFYII